MMKCIDANHFSNVALSVCNISPRFRFLRVKFIKELDEFLKHTPQYIDNQKQIHFGVIT